MNQKPWRQLAFVLGEAFLSLLSGGVLFVIISRASGPALLGTYALALAWLMLFQGVSSFGIPEFILREAGAHGRDGASQVVHAMLLGVGTGLLATALMLISVRLLGYPSDIVLAISIASLALIPIFFQTACRSVFVAQREMHVPFLAALAEVTLMMASSLYLLFSGYGVTALIVAMVFAKLISASFSLAVVFTRVFPERPPFDRGMLVRTAQTVATFGVGNVIGMLSMRISMIMLSVWANIETVGHYAAATKVMEIGLIPPYLFSQLLLTRIAHSFTTRGSRDPNSFAAWYKVLLALVVPPCVGVWVFAAPILEILFGKSFGDAFWVLRILMIYLLIETADTVMSVILKAAHKQRADVICLSFNLLINVVLNLVLLPFLGPIGTAIGRVGGGAASTITRHFVIARELTSVRWLQFVLRPALISIGVGSVCYVLLDLERPVWLLLFYVAATLALLRIFASFSFSAIKDMMSFPAGPD